MDTRSLLNHLEGQGLCLTLDPEGLRVEPRSSLTTETRRLIRAHRGELIELVSQRPKALPAELNAIIRRIAAWPEFQIPPSELGEMIEGALLSVDTARTSYTDTARAWGLL